MKLRPPIKCHGGKYYLCQKIIPLLPDHTTFTETFGGGASVLLNKSHARCEIFNDIDADLINLYRVMVNNPHGFLDRLHGMDYSQGVFDWASQQMQTRLTDDMGLAVAYLVRNRMSRGGMNKAFSWSDRRRGGQPGDVNAWDTFRRVNLPLIIRRLKNVHICNEDAVAVMERFDADETLHYCDPPYVPETRKSKRVYAHEMPLADHLRLLSAITRMKGTVAISGYHCPIYDAALARWKLYEFDMPNHSGQGKKKQRRTECLWLSR